MCVDEFELDDDELSVLDLEDRLDVLLRTCCPKCDTHNADTDVIRCKGCGFTFSPVPMRVNEDDGEVD